MKILWVNSIFLHPTNKGGQIRTLEILRRLHGRHEIHYAALDSGDAEGVARAGEYSTRAYPVKHRIHAKTSAAFLWQLAGGLFSAVPVVVARKRSQAMRELIAGLTERESFDRIVCDFLSPSINLPDLGRAVLFQHNVETAIWRRYARQAADPARRFYFARQAERMEAYERDVCRRVRRVLAVSEADAELMRSEFGAERVSVVPTGVDAGYFNLRPDAEPRPGLVFVGSMDWMPNVDGVLYFAREILPRIRQRRPDTRFTIVGRTPPKQIAALARGDAGIFVTGTVPDVRPWLSGGAVSVVPLRIGGGTRLKIYEAMAAGSPVVSTTVGAEGLEIDPPRNIRIADQPQDFAAECVALLEDAGARRGMAAAAREMVESRFSWERAAERFEEILASS